MFLWLGGNQQVNTEMHRLDLINRFQVTENSRNYSLFFSILGHMPISFGKKPNKFANALEFVFICYRN